MKKKITKRKGGGGGNNKKLTKTQTLNIENIEEEVENDFLPVT